MRSVAVLLCAALFGLNAEAALLHAHTGEGDEHHHGPAAHYHQLSVKHQADHSEMSAPDDDDTVVPVGLVKATATQVHHLVALPIHSVRIDVPTASQPTHFFVTARAHGPPRFSPTSPRAPPRTSRL
jgi:hypothetical protein